jgi:hypothetical protein
MSLAVVNAHAVFMVLIGGMILAPRLGAAADQIPPDFHLSVGFEEQNIAAKRGDVLSWATDVTADGRVVQSIKYNPPHHPVRKREAHFSQKEMFSLVAEVKKQGFFTPPQNSINCEDCGLFTLKLTMGGQTHEVFLAWASFVKDKSIVRRIRDIWARVVKKMPAPDGKNDELRNLQENS